jgi:hypothetical protein
MWIIFVFVINAAASVRPHYTEDSRGKWIVGDSCAVLEEELTGFRDWKRKMDGEAPEGVICEQTPGKPTYRILVDSYIPQKALDLIPSFNLNSKDIFPGPNCINEALYMSGIISDTFYSRYMSMKHMINVGLCGEITVDQAFAGDIITFGLQKNDTPIHAATFVSKTFLFEKWGLDGGFGINTLWASLGWGRPVQYFRCQSWNSFSQSQKGLIDRHDKLLQKLKSIEDNISKFKKRGPKQVTEKEVEQVYISANSGYQEAWNELMKLNGTLSPIEREENDDYGLLQIVLGRFHSAVLQMPAMACMIASPGRSVENCLGGL